MINQITYKNIEPVLEAGKELARVAIIAAIPVMIDGLSAGQVNWQLVATGGLIAILRGLDKFLHLEGKTSGNELLTGGLTRF